MTDALDEPTIRVVQNEAREAAALIPVQRGIVSPQDFSQIADRAKYMAQSKEAIPAHMRGNVGMCIAIHEMAGDWGFRPYGVANLSYIVNNKLAFEAQLMIAVVNKHGGLTQRLRPRYEGEGDDLVCIVQGQFNGEVDVCEYRSPKLGTIHPKNSPLWKVDPPRQLFYYSARGFIRMFCPQIMLGIFGYDELQDNPHIGADNAKDVTDASQALHERLSAAKGNGSGEGFRHGVVEEGLAPPPTQGTFNPDSEPLIANEAGHQKRKRRTKAEMEAARQAAADPTPEVKAEPPAEDGLAFPATPEGYAEHCRAWIAESTDYKEAVKRWTDENAIRDRLAVPVDQRIALRDSITSRFERPS